MGRYQIEIIPGTKEFVKVELSSKFPRCSILEESPDLILVESEVTDIDEFRELKSALRVTNEGGTTRNVFRRDWQKQYVPAGINPALAYILCQLADIEADDTVIDPFCGSGTIAVSAALYFQPRTTLAADLSGAAVNKAIANFKSAGIPKRNYTVFRSNISQLKMQRNSLDKVISNLPFGVRNSDHQKNVKAYTQLAQRMKSMLRPGGKLVLLTQEKKLLEQTFGSYGYNLIEEFEITQGGLSPSIYIYNNQ